jgi:phenylalanyl-tRNA synthetase beta chain
VVCGAPNVEVGAKYPLARVGTVVPGKGGMTIERRKIRGFTSAGMLCSAMELGLGADHEGILALATDAAPGTPILDVLAAGDVRLEFDVLANRPTCCRSGGLPASSRPSPASRSSAPRSSAARRRCRPSSPIRARRAPPA